MLFTEARFLFFFLVVFALYWSVRNHTFRRAWLLLCSYAFYAAWRWEFLSLIVASTVVDYVVGRLLERTDAHGRRRLLLTVSLVVNLGLLAVFKYYDFFVTSGVELLGWLGIGAEASTLELILPVGISFYTFQTLSYTIDVYRGRMACHRNLLDFALFVGFFPQLVAGPIVRAADFLPQLSSLRRFADVDVRPQLTLFLLGFVKKACVSDNVAPIVDQVFAEPGAWDWGTHWLAATLYTIQIYCDFSGYSDMAIASAGLLGYRLMLNFDFPYLARSITEFWRRWHISLSTWFRDYLYIPLGGNRGGPGATYRNLVIVFFLCGLWHGASWSFVVWGLYHGLFLVVERVGLGRALDRAPGLVRHGYVLLVALLGWVFFRAEGLDAAVVYLGALVPGTGGEAVDEASLWWAGVGGFALVHAIMGRQILVDRLRAMPDWLYAVAYGAAVALALPWVATDYQPFIYFQF